MLASRELWLGSAKFRVAGEDVSLEASLVIIPPVPPVVVVVLHVVVAGYLVLVLVHHDGLGLVVGEDLHLVPAAHHVIVLVLADNHLQLCLASIFRSEYMICPAGCKFSRPNVTQHEMTPIVFCSENKDNPDLPYSGIIRVGVVDHQLAAGPGAADGDPRVVIAGLGVCPTDAALSVHIVSWGQSGALQVRD